MLLYKPKEASLRLGELILTFFLVMVFECNGHAIGIVPVTSCWGKVTRSEAMRVVLEVLEANVATSNTKIMHVHSSQSMPLLATAHENCMESTKIYNAQHIAMSQ